MMLARRTRRRNISMLAGRHGGTNPWLCTHDPQLAQLTCRNRIENLRDERAEVIDPIAVRANEDHANGVRGEILLELKVLVHRDKNVKMANRLPQERAVDQSSPAEPDDGLRVEPRQMFRKVDRNRLVK